MREKWTAAQIDILVARYPHERTADIARDIGRSVESCYAKAQLLGLKKTEAYLAGPSACRLRANDHPGLQTRFQKGQKPWNAGTHYEAGGRSEQTRFKKGSVPPNRLPVGHIRLNSEGYLDIKIAPGPRKWVPLHRWNWLQATGEFPARGMIIAFKDGDRMNCDISNLICITLQENMARNTVHKLPKAVAEIVQLRGALLRKIRHAERKQLEATA